MRRIVPVRYILHAMRARGRESTHTAAHSTWATHALADGGTRGRGASGARARLRASERAPSARQQQQQAEDLELLPHVEADCRELEEGVEKVTALLGRGEARALPARTLPRALQDLVRAVVARGDRRHDGEKMCCATLSCCSSSNGVQTGRQTGITGTYPRPPRRSFTPLQPSTCTHAGAHAGLTVRSEGFAPRRPLPPPGERACGEPRTRVWCARPGDRCYRG